MNFITTKHDYALELLEDIVKEDPPVLTDLIICSTREGFVDQLLVLLDRHDTSSRVAISKESEDASQGEVEEAPPTECSPTLLTPTLQLLNASRLCNLIFCPTTTVLRGYLASYCPWPGSSKSMASPLADGRVVILNLLALHHGTSEFTLQGLSQTFATAVSAGYRAKRQLELVECKDIRDPSNPSRGPALWHAEVQLLSGAVKIGEEGSGWGRRSISVVTIASRWFQIRQSVNKDDEGHRSQHDKRAWSGDEMLV